MLASGKHRRAGAAPGPCGVGAARGYWEFLDVAEPEPAARGLVRLASVKRKSWHDEKDVDGVYVPADQAALGAPWPQLGFALLARVGGNPVGVAQSRAGVMAQQPVAVP